MPKEVLWDGLKPEQSSALYTVWFWQRPSLKRKFQAMNRAEYGDQYSDKETYQSRLRAIARAAQD